MVPTKHAATGIFEPLQLMGNHQQSLGVLVPSKPPGSGQSRIRGKRIGVKEAFQIAGIRPALSNRAYYDMSVSAKRTAPAIERLIQLGAVILGTTKCSSMISREDPVEGKSTVRSIDAR